jgi:polar amino acid transport system ATP-binding protein
MSFVRLAGVSKSFGSVKVLGGVDLAVERGQAMALIGRSGSGKSTLLRCLNGLERIDGGSIMIDGDILSYRRRDLRALRRSVGIVFQSFNLFPHLSVEGNVTLALRKVRRIAPKEARERAEAALSEVGLADKLGAYPVQLSGGQQQRVAIARALAMEPKLMLFDEITSSLDPELVGEVLRVLEALVTKGMTMLLVTHEMGFARRAASRIVFMHQGRIAESGPPERLLSDPSTPELRDFIGKILSTNGASNV